MSYLLKTPPALPVEWHTSGSIHLSLANLLILSPISLYSYALLVDNSSLYDFIPRIQEWLLISHLHPVFPQSHHFTTL